MNHLQNQNIGNLKKLIYNNEENFISILSEITKFEIEEIDSIEIVKAPLLIKDEVFIILKVRVKIYGYKKIELYLKIIDKGQLEKTIRYYWILIYEEEFIRKGDIRLCEKIINNKIKIIKINEEKFTDTFFLEIQNNKTNILKYGAMLYITEFNKYLINKRKELKSYIDREEILFIGIKNNKGMNNFLFKVHS